MRVEDAKERWCPFVRMGVIVYCKIDGDERELQLAGYNRMYFGGRAEEEPRGKCLAFGCMSWREDSVLNDLQYEKYKGIIPEEKIHGFCDLLRRAKQDD